MDDAPASTTLAAERQRIKILGVTVPTILGLDLAYLAGSTVGRGTAVTLFVAFTALTGYADSQGFIHAARIWDSGQLVAREMFLSGIAFFVGVLAYWVVVRFISELGVKSALLQTMGWFAVTIAAVWLADAGAQRWQALDTATALVVIAGLGLLLYRAAG